ncbi:MAG: replicative DNA helicase [bacterium]
MARSPNAFLERVPPQNLEAEASVLGGILLENQAVLKVAEVVQPEDFYREAHRKIFRAMVELQERGEPVDLITLKEEMNVKGWLQEVGGAVYLASLVDRVPTAANILYYARIVKEKSILRQVIEASTEIVREAYEEPANAVDFLDKAEQTVLEIARRQQRKGFIPLRTVLQDNFQTLENMFGKQGMITGVATGFADFDRVTCGLQRSDLIILAGRPSMGKTALALNIARNAAVESHTPVAIFSLEMSKEQLAFRLLCGEAQIDGSRLRAGYFEKSAWKNLTAAADVLSQAPIYIDDSAGITVREMRGKARQMKLENKIGLVVVDYLQLMQGSERSESRVQEISEISRSLKQLAKELDLPVLALSQLNRAVENRPDKRPILADLRESGAIEQDADVIAFIYREEFYFPDRQECKGKAELRIGKQRNGPIDNIQLQFEPRFTLFRTLSTRREDAM